jgi:hypothetical protein
MLCRRKLSVKMKGRVYRACVTAAMVYSVKKVFVQCTKKFINDQKWFA